MKVHRNSTTAPVVTLDYPTQKTFSQDRKYFRMAALIPVDVMLPILAEKALIQFGDHPSRIRTDSVRLQTYTHGIHCARTGHPIAYFAAECQIHQYDRAVLKGIPFETLNLHINAYAVVDGQEIMMTSDHIVPKSIGGLDSNVKNRQPMLTTPNGQKAAVMTDADIQLAISRGLMDANGQLLRP